MVIAWWRERQARRHYYRQAALVKLQKAVTYLERREMERPKECQACKEMRSH